MLPCWVCVRPTCGGGHGGEHWMVGMLVPTPARAHLGLRLVLMLVGPPSATAWPHLACRPAASVPAKVVPGRRRRRQQSAHGGGGAGEPVHAWNGTATSILFTSTLFGTTSHVVLFPTPPPTRRMPCSFYVVFMPIGACNPMVCPRYVFRMSRCGASRWPSPGSARSRSTQRRRSRRASARSTSSRPAARRSRTMSSRPAPGSPQTSPRSSAA